MSWFVSYEQKKKKIQQERIRRENEITQRENDLKGKQPEGSNKSTYRLPSSSSEDHTSDEDPTFDAMSNPLGSENSNNPAPVISAEEALVLLNEMRTEITALRSGMETMRASQTPIPDNTPPPQPQSSGQLSRQEIMLRNFVRSPLSAHKEINPNKPMLDYDGIHFQLWHDALDRTLMHFFMKKESFLNTVTNFEGLSIDENSSITSIIRNTIESGLIGIVNGSKLTAPLELYNLLKKNCSKSDRRHKIDLVNRLMELANDPTPADGHTLSKWATVVAELDQLKVTWEEVSGLILQATFTPPSGVDVKTFEFSVDQQLDGCAAPVFADVSSIIQAATGKLKAKASTGPAPMDLDRLQAMQPSKYVTPGRRQAPQDKPAPHISVDKATHYKGRGQSEALINRYGNVCGYCDKEGHWYSDCTEFWRDVATKKIPSPPDNYKSNESRYQPPRRSDNDRLRQVNIPNVTDGCLLDSGASAHCDDSDADRAAEDQ
ncbi:Dcp1p-Dcp2p decapping enzyme complex alpha subunit [Puccinia graminis f. sp. tritici]|uniref:Dcp1p-Dcp2p decapping enzyme complex alpha subunit n=1 Tax=Puccinia graminis f. sp. tritici TaxID=56615 RepID=A0A5B0NZU4_PUCGR|nr:Dcp1p-Dcp2p decapping enzyme complex alpha subunit [Puccinia graminis f. sp. tritici]